MLVMLFLLIAAVIGNLAMGSMKISLRDVMAVLAGRSSDETAVSVIRDIRMPRMIAAVVLGGALAVSGLLLQTFFGNPIAGPYVLGISSGAKLMVALAMIGLLARGVTISSFGMVAAAFIGSLISMGFVLLISTRVKNMALLVVCGVMIGYICSAITDFVVTFADDSDIVNLHNWSQGSFSGIGWKQIPVLCVIVLLMTAAALLISKPAGAHLLGEDYARSMGVNIRRLRVLLILISSMLSACVTAFAGPISFVGIAVPHLVRSITRTSRPLLLVPAGFLGGALVTLLCDGLARTMFAPTEVSISSVTAVFLVPVVIVMMVRRRK
jgi:iron complex transport system permease protein